VGGFVGGGGGGLGGMGREAEDACLLSFPDSEWACAAVDTCRSHRSLSAMLPVAV